LRARYYAPGLGVFASLDPTECDVQWPTLNKYGYAAQNPANMVDPSGMIADLPNKWDICSSSNTKRNGECNIPISFDTAQDASYQKEAIDLVITEYSNPDHNCAVQYIDALKDHNASLAMNVLKFSAENLKWGTLYDVVYDPGLGLGVRAEADPIQRTIHIGDGTFRGIALGNSIISSEFRLSTGDMLATFIEESAHSWQYEHAKKATDFADTDPCFAALNTTLILGNDLEFQAKAYKLSLPSQLGLSFMETLSLSNTCHIYCSDAVDNANTFLWVAGSRLKCSEFFGISSSQLPATWPDKNGWPKVRDCGLCSRH